MTDETPIDETSTDDQTFLTTEIVYHKQEGRPDVFVAGKGERIPMQVAINLGLVKGIKSVKPAAKAVTPSEVENKTLKPAAKSSRKSTTSKG